MGVSSPFVYLCLRVRDVELGGKVKGCGLVNSRVSSQSVCVVKVRKEVC